MTDDTTITWQPDCPNGTAFDAYLGNENVGRVFHVHRDGWRFRIMFDDPDRTLRLVDEGSAQGGPFGDPDTAKTALAAVLHSEAPR